MAHDNTARKNASMDDILSSIRQIISETEERAVARRAIPAEQPANDVAPARLPASLDEPPAPEATAATVEAPPSSTAEIERLTAVQDEDDLASILSRLETEIAPAPKIEPPAPTVKPLSAADDHAFRTVGQVLTQAVSIEGSPGAAIPQMQEVDPPMQDVVSEPETSSEIAINLARDSRGHGSLVSQQTEASVSEQLSKLDALLSRQSGSSLNERVDQMLKPLLQEWLDDNLPNIVERAVRAEIERLARGEPRG
ncbi:MAG: DUF2497 domain-containing protein [Pseudomonadota bacterium]